MDRRMSDDERPDHALLLNLSEVLRRFGDRQREMLAVVRQLHMEWQATPGAPRHPTFSPATPIGSSPVAAPPVAAPPIPAPPIPAAPALLPPAPITAAAAGTTPSVPPPVVEEPAGLTLRTTRDYDYFEELDARLARLRRDEDPGTV
jgi:hypothetical protein